MRYTVRRLRRKLPAATIILGCFIKDIDTDALNVLRDNAKADLVAATLGEVVKLCIEATGVSDQRQAAPEPQTRDAALAEIPLAIGS
jgi:hypothetical protein